MELRFHSPEIASLAVERFRADGHLAWVVDEHSPFLWGPAVVSGVRVLLVDEPILEDDELPEEEVAVAAKIRGEWVQSFLNSGLCCCCLLVMLVVGLAPSSGIWSSPLFYSSLALFAVLLVPASGKILTTWIRRGNLLVLCACCLLLGLVSIMDLLLLAMRSPVFFAAIVISVFLGLFALSGLGRRLASGFNDSVLRTGEWRSLSDFLWVGVAVLAILVRGLLAY
jgi:hypothetical protein